MPPPMRRQRLPLLIALPVVALGAAAILWWIVRGDGPGAPQSAARPAGEAAESARRAVDPLGYVALRTDVHNSRNLADLVHAYGLWASRPDALAARRNIVSALLTHRDPLAGLQALLAAVELDQTPRTDDPLWRDLVRQVGALWNAVTLNYVRDQVLIEARAKPKELLLESLAEIPPERLADHQRPLLAGDLIDLFPGLAADQKPAFNKALHALVGSDVVEILAGRGLTKDGPQLQAAAGRKQVLEKIRRNPVRERPAEE